MIIDDVDDFSSEDISERISRLFKKVNMTQFSREHSIPRKNLYKMRDKGVLPRHLLLDLCKRAKINPVLVEFSPDERLFYFERLSDYFENYGFYDLYKKELDEANKHNNDELVLSLSLLHKLFVEGDLLPISYCNRVKEVKRDQK